MMLRTYHGTRPTAPTFGVVERQHVVHAVVRLGVERAGKAVHHIERAHMAEIRRLRQAGRARGEDEERIVAIEDPAAPGGIGSIG
jgi:hypothetical protein